MKFDGYKLLLIDDDRIVRESVAAYLEDCGYEILEAEDGQQGYELYLSESPQLIICDIRMPRMDGLSMLKKISEDEREIATPVIVVSGAGGMADVVKALRLGANDYMVKPIVDMKVLEHSVERSLERAQLLLDNRRYREELELANRDLKEYVQLLEQDQRAGLQMQLSMFPQEPLESGKYRFEHVMIPSLYLSGDFLEYMEYDQRYICFYIADVSGHGSSSAFVTALLHHLTLSVLRQTKQMPPEDPDHPFSTPADVLAYFSRELLTVGMDKYVTMFFGVIDTDHNRLHYSVAGHLPMPVLASDEGVFYLEGKGMPLGVVADVHYQNYMIELPDTFTLALFSDGILEILPEEGLIKQEAYLLNLINDGARSLEHLKGALALGDIKEAPDDIAVMTVTKHL